MGNAKSRNDNHHYNDDNRKISRNLSQPQLTTRTSSLPTKNPHHNPIQQHRQREEDVLWTTIPDNTTNTTTGIVGGPPLLVHVKHNSKTTTKTNKAKEDRQQKAADTSAALTESQQQQHHQQQKQASFWSLGSLNWSLSFSGRNSFKQRQKSSRKSYSTLQYQRRSKTQWHKPLTNAIFSSHFKESSRNGEFHIDHLVAKGAFGVVFRVIDKNLIKQKQQQVAEAQRHHHQPQLIADNHCSTSPVFYALKVLKKSKIISENSIQQIKDEADIQKLCGHHPFIVKQFDLWQNRYNLHILSEYIPNGELFSKIGAFSLNLIRVYLAEIALALDFLHNAGIIYRDAKPENILLTADYHLKLTDFGLSKWLKLGLTTKTMCGTFQYMAPEILRGEPYTHSVDWWSLGIIVCQMFVKKSPDIRQFITINLPDHLKPIDCVDDVSMAKRETNANAEGAKSNLKDMEDFLPEEVKTLPHEAKDVLQRLLDFDGQKRLHSVRGLQRIAMYKDFKIDTKYILNLRPLDIIVKDGITLFNDDDQLPEHNSFEADKAFKNF